MASIISSYIVNLIEGISRLLRLILIDRKTDVACCSVPEIPNCNYDCDELLNYVCN